MDENKKIASYRNLDVYKNSYTAMLLVMKQIVPKLPECEKFDLTDQLRRSRKAIPRLIAEGYAKKHQKAGFQKYIDDAMAESNETVVSLSQARDIYAQHVDVKLCEQLADAYDKIGRQLYKLGVAWTDFKGRSRET